MGDLVYFPIATPAADGRSRVDPLLRIIATYGRLIQQADARGDEAAVLEYARRRTGWQRLRLAAVKRAAKWSGP